MEETSTLIIKTKNKKTFKDENSRAFCDMGKMSSTFNWQYRSFLLLYSPVSNLKKLKKEWKLVFSIQSIMTVTSGQNRFYHNTINNKNIFKNIKQKDHILVVEITDYIDIPVIGIVILFNFT